MQPVIPPPAQLTHCTTAVSAVYWVVYWVVMKATATQIITAHARCRHLHKRCVDKKVFQCSLTGQSSITNSCQSNVLLRITRIPLPITRIQPYGHKPPNTAYYAAPQPPITR